MSGHKIYFGEFTLDTLEGLLFRGQSRVHVRPQGIQVLAFLAKHQGELVTRDDLAGILWADSRVDANLGLNAIIRNLRQALGDDPGSPQYIETIPTKGYRFVASSPAENTDKSAPRIRSRPIKIAATLGLLVALVLAGVLGGRDSQPSPPTFDDIPAAARLAYMQGLQQYRNGEVIESRSSFENVVSLAPAFPEGHLSLGKSLIFAPDVNLALVKRAEPHIREYLQFHPESTSTHLALSRIAMIKDLDIEKATYWAKKAAALDPHDIEALDQLAEIHLVIGDVDGALDYVGQIESLDPLVATNWTYRGWILFLSGDYEAAASHCRTSLSVNPENQAARGCLFESYLALDVLDLARKHAVEILKQSDAPPGEVKFVENATVGEAIQRFLYWRLEGAKDQAAAGGDPYPLILLYWMLGLEDEAISQLKKVALERHYTSILRLSVDSRLDVFADNASLQFAFNLFR